MTEKPTRIMPAFAVGVDQPTVRYYHYVSDYNWRNGIYVNLHGGTHYSESSRTVPQGAILCPLCEEISRRIGGTIYE